MILRDAAAFPRLETARLRLRAPTRTDAEAIFAFRRDPVVTYFNNHPAYIHIDEAAAFIEGLIVGYRAGAELRWAITPKDSDTVIGLVGFNGWDRRRYCASVGYDLARPYWGHGLMTEAVRAIIAYGFHDLGFQRMEADASARNLASLRVLRKAGFKQVGIRRDQVFIDGSSHDMLLFALLRAEFLPELTAD